MPESPMNCFKVHKDYDMEKLQMTSTTLDPCLLFRRGKDIIDGIIGVHVHGTICASTSSFSTE